MASGSGEPADSSSTPGGLLAKRACKPPASVFSLIQPAIFGANDCVTMVGPLHVHHAFIIWTGPSGSCQSVITFNSVSLIGPFGSIALQWLVYIGTHWTIWIDRTAMAGSHRDSPLPWVHTRPFGSDQIIWITPNKTNGDVIFMHVSLIRIGCGGVQRTCMGSYSVGCTSGKSSELCNEMSMDGST